MFVLWNGFKPVSISYRVMPMAKMSERLSSFFASDCSGLM